MIMKLSIAQESLDVSLSIAREQILVLLILINLYQTLSYFDKLDIITILNIAYEDSDVLLSIAYIINTEFLKKMDIIAILSIV